MIITLVIIGGLNQAGNRGFNCRGFSTSYKSQAMFRYITMALKLQ